MATFFLSSGILQADELQVGRQLFAQGRYAEAAEHLNRYIGGSPRDKKDVAEALMMCGRSLDAIADQLTEVAEKKCYWVRGAPRTPECMQRHASDFNSRFGQGAFNYEHTVTYIPYTGLHYRMLLDRFPDSRYAPEADFYLLLRELVGHPDTVLPRVKAFLKRYPKGEWHRKGLLLWARVNEDIWYVHRKWSWVLYNYHVEPDDLIIRAEPYRQEALRTYELLMKDKESVEARQAVREYSLLKANQEDPHVYSIVADSSAGTLASWGIWSPGAVGSAEPGIGDVGGSVPSAQSPAADEPTERMKPSVPRRWE